MVCGVVPCVAVGVRRGSAVSFEGEEIHLGEEFHSVADRVHRVRDIMKSVWEEG